MSSARPAAPDPTTGHLPPHIIAALEEAHQFQDEGKAEAAINRLEEALANTSGDSELDHFKQRVSLTIALAEFLVTAGNSEKAVASLAKEFGLAKALFQSIKAKGTEEDKRMAFRGLVQLRDLHTRLRLIEKPAPEIAVQEWLNGQPLSLVDLRGKVVLLEFWATWCKPCEQMFPKIKEFHQARAARGLEVIALTRFFMAYGGSPEAQAQEMTLIREFANTHSIEFPVGVSADESTQDAYGATALPMFALIDRTGVVRSFAFSPEDEKFKQTVDDCLNEGS